MDLFLQAVGKEGDTRDAWGSLKVPRVKCNGPLAMGVHCTLTILESEREGPGGRLPSGGRPGRAPTGTADLRARPQRGGGPAPASASASAPSGPEAWCPPRPQMGRIQS